MLLAKLFSYLPFWLLYLLSDVLAWLLGTVIRYRRQVVLDNLQHAFPGKDEKWLQGTASAFYRSFTDTWLEALKSLSLTADQIRKRVHVENAELMQQEEEKDNSSLLFTGHNANWEWVLLRGGLALKQVHAVYLRVNNPFFDKLMYRIRNRFGIKLVNKDDLMRTLISSRGTFKNVAMVADQAPTVHLTRHWQNFMHRPSPFFNSGEKLALKEGMSLYYIGVKRIRRGYYSMWFEPLAQAPHQPLEEGTLTSRYIQALEKNIRLQPELYLWSHKRWKHSMPAGTSLYPAES